MKIIVAGSRGLWPFHTFAACNTCPFTFTEVVSGCAPGPDTDGETWAHRNHVPIKQFPANWDKHGTKAGILRNIEMGDYADALVAVWDGKSKGTKHMIEYMQKLNKPVFIYKPGE